MQWKDFIAKLIDSGLTQVQIAAEAGCGQNTVSDLFTGKTGEPRGTLALALLRVGERHGVKPEGVMRRTEREKSA